MARPDAPGGIPDVELFALRVPGVGLLGVAAAGAFFGLKGLLAAAVLGEQGKVYPGAVAMWVQFPV